MRAFDARLDAVPRSSSVRSAAAASAVAAVRQHAQPDAELRDAVYPGQFAQQSRRFDAVGAFDFVDVGVHGVHEIARRPFGHQPPLGEDGEAVAALGFIHVVRGHENGGALLGELEQAIPEVAAALRIHRAGGLVEQQQFRRVQRGRGQRQALLLSATHGAGALVAQ